MRSMIQASVTMGQIQKQLDLIGHNLANVNTTGYKSRQANFSSLLFQQMNNNTATEENAERLTPDGIRIGHGAKLSHTNSKLTQGSLLRTDRNLDIALLNSTHYLQVQVENNGQLETRYTREGNLYLNQINDQEMMLVTSDGHPLIGENGPITLEQGFDDIMIQEDGNIIVNRNNRQTTEASLAIVDAIRPRSLEATGKNMFRIPVDADFNEAEIIQNVARSNIQLHSGALEQSNVDLSQQMVDMMMAQRAYQFNAKSISIGDQMMGLVNQLR